MLFQLQKHKHVKSTNHILTQILFFSNFQILKSIKSVHLWHFIVTDNYFHQSLTSRYYFIPFFATFEFQSSCCNIHRRGIMTINSRTLELHQRLSSVKLQSQSLMVGCLNSFGWKCCKLSQEELSSMQSELQVQFNIFLVANINLSSD